MSGRETLELEESPVRLPQLDDWMTAQEVADWLGISTLVLSHNQVPHAKVGKRRFYNKHDVAGWLNRRVEGRR